MGEENAVRVATCNPACAIWADKQVGSIETGKVADFLVCGGYRSRRVFMTEEELALKINESVPPRVFYQWH